MNKSYKNNLSAFTLSTHLKADSPKWTSNDNVSIGKELSNEVQISIGNKNGSHCIESSTNDSLIFGFDNSSITVFGDNNEILLSGKVSDDILELLKQRISESRNFIGNYKAEAKPSVKNITDRIISKPTKEGYITDLPKVIYDGTHLYVKSDYLKTTIQIKDPVLGKEINIIKQVNNPEASKSYFINGQLTKLSKGSRKETFKVKSEKEFKDKVSKYKPKFMNDEISVDVEFSMDLIKEEKKVTMKTKKSKKKVKGGKKND